MSSKELDAAVETPIGIFFSIEILAIKLSAFGTERPLMPIGANPKGRLNFSFKIVVFNFRFDTFFNALG